MPTSQLHDEISKLGKKDIFLWALNVCVLFVLFAGFAALVLPNLFTHHDEVLISSHRLPELLTSLVSALILFVIYVKGQRRELSQARDSLYRRLLLEQSKPEGLLDPETHFYSLVMFHSLVERMSAEATDSTPLSMLSVEIPDLDAVRRQNGEPAVEHLVRSVAELLRTSLRGSDRICRTGEGSFVALLPDTSTAMAHIPAQRIERAVTRWNTLAGALGYKLQTRLRVSSAASRKIAPEMPVHAMRSMHQERALAAVGTA